MFTPFVGPGTFQITRGHPPCKQNDIHIGEIMNKTTFLQLTRPSRTINGVVDATDVPLGRLSAVVASVLRGKTNQHSHTDTE